MHTLGRNALRKLHGHNNNINTLGVHGILARELNSAALTLCRSRARIPRTPNVYMENIVNDVNKGVIKNKHT